MATVGVAINKEELLREKLNIPPSFKYQLKEINKYKKYLFLPKGVQDLKDREFNMNKMKSKRSFLKRLWNPLTVFGICVIFFIATWAVLAPWISPYSYVAAAANIDYNRLAFLPPSPGHILGTGYFGRDVYSRMIWGARTSLSLGVTAISIAVVGGVILGLIAAFYGGWVDNLIMRIADVFMAFPGLILTVVCVAIFGRKMWIIMLVFGILSIPGYSRLMRGAALTEVSKPYVQTARVAGASNMRIIFRHVFSNSIAPIIVQCTFDIGGMILSLAGLGFLGFSDPTMIEWGEDISQARGYLTIQPFAPFAPGFAILITVLGFMLLGDGLRDAFDPRLKH